jgi:hypothetical protein
VGPDLATLFAQDFEQGMDRFFVTRNVHVSALLREMAAYFAQFEPLAGNCYAELLKILTRAKRTATFVSMNYDCLLEIAATYGGLLIDYRGLPVNRGHISVLKIHGSCNFWPDLDGGSIRGVGFVMPDTSGGIIEVAPHIARSAAEVTELCRREDAIAPAIAMYSSSKRILYCPGFIGQQRSAWIDATAVASAVYVIGLRVHPVDTHVWEPLARTRAPVYYVGRHPDEFFAWSTNARKGRRRSYVLADSFQTSLPRIADHCGLR